MYFSNPTIHGCKGFAAAALLLCAAILLVVFAQNESHRVHAATAITELEGYAWSSTIGWISMNCSNDSSCGTSNYKVEIMDDMSLQGYAWSSNIGWVKFGGLSGCPGGTCDARINTSTNEVEGWARACAGTAPGDCTSMSDHIDGWDGWISLNCENTGTCGTSAYAVAVGAGVLSSFSWGSDVVGWLEWSNVTFDSPCSPTLSCTADNSGSEHTDQWCTTTIDECPDGTLCLDSDPTQCIGEASGSITAEDVFIQYGNTTTLEWSATNVEECTVTQGTTELGTWAAVSGSVESQPVYGETLVTLTCTDLNGVEQDIDSVKIQVIPVSFES